MESANFAVTVKKIKLQIVSLLKENAVTADESAVIAAAYALYKAAAEGRSYFEAAEVLSEEENLAAAQFLTNTEVFAALKYIYAESDRNIYRHIVLGTVQDLARTDAETPNTVAQLINRLLRLQAGDSVIDICSGRGQYITVSAAMHPEVRFTGVEKDVRQNALAQLRLRVLAEGEDSRQCEFISDDAFNYFAFLRNHGKYDKAFSHYPLNVKYGDRGPYSDYIRDSRLYHAVFKRCSSDWYFNEMLISSVKEGGRAAGIISAGACSNKIDEQARRYFAGSGLVEAVIKMPLKVCSGLSLPLNIIVLSRGNKGVRFVDASEKYLPGRRFNTLSEKNINDIVKACSEDGPDSRFVTMEEIAASGYTLAPERYLAAAAEIENGVKLGDIISEIKRVMVIKASELDALATEEPTDVRYLRLADIQDGMIADGLPYLKGMNRKIEKHLLADGDMLLSKILQPFKAAVASLKEGEKILPVGNMYMLEFDTSRANPYYIKAFLESERGLALFKNMTTGSTVPVISVDMLKNLVIPLPDMAEQNLIAERYRAAQQKVKKLRRELNSALKEMSETAEKV